MHRKEDPDFNVQNGFTQLVALDLLATHARLTLSQPLDRHGSLFSCQEAGRRGQIRERKTKSAEQRCQGSREQIKALPPVQTSGRDLGKALVEGIADDDEPSCGRVPPALL